MDISSTLFIIWPDAEAPRREDVTRSLSPWLEEGDEVAHDGQFWARSMRGSGAAVTVWLSRQRFAFRWGEASLSPEDEALARQARWVVGVELGLDVEDPARSYMDQLRFARAAAPAGALVFDRCSGALRSLSSVERLVNAGTPPSLREMMALHAVGPGPNEEGGLWLHSHGLARAHVPDLEIFLPNLERLPQARALIEATAEQILARPGILKDRLAELGRAIAVGLREWQELDEREALESFGKRDESHRGWRLVLTEPGGVSPPVTALRALSRGGEHVYVSRRETERMAGLARERWPSFGMLFARDKSHPRRRFLVKLEGAKSEADSSRRTFDWFEVLELQPGRLRVRDRGLGTERWAGLEYLTDWVIQTELGSFSPENAEALWFAGQGEEAEGR